MRPFPDVAAGRCEVSTGGGTRPLWSRDGREMFYLDAGRRLTAVPVEPRASFHAGALRQRGFEFLEDLLALHVHVLSGNAVACVSSF